MEAQSSTAPAAPESGAVEASPESKRVGKDGLFKPRPKKTKWVTLPDGREILVGALTPKEIAEINERTVDYVDDPNKPGESKTKIHPMRVFYMIARALREPDGKRMYSSLGDGPDTAYVLAGDKIASLLEQDEVDVLRDAVFEVSGLNKKARDDAGKGSGPTRNTA